jgi:hypothetical protein
MECDVAASKMTAEKETCAGSPELRRAHHDVFMFFDPRSSVHFTAVHGPFNHPADLIIDAHVGDSLEFFQKFTFVSL